MAQRTKGPARLTSIWGVSRLFPPQYGDHDAIFRYRSKSSGTREIHTMSIATMGDARRLCDAVAVEHTVTTAEAAVLLGVSQQTMRRWSCQGSGPIRPRRVNGRLRWSVAEIRAVVNSPL